MSDDRYEAPVGGMTPDRVSEAMVQSIEAVQAFFPSGTGLCVFAFDFGGSGGGMGYISNAEKESMIEALEEWIARAKRGLVR